MAPGLGIEAAGGFLTPLGAGAARRWWHSAFEVKAGDEPGHLDDEAATGIVGPDDREALPEHEGPGIVDNMGKKVTLSKEYTLMVDTGKLPTAATHGDVYLQLFGSKDRTGLIHLKQG
ncbi:unnamed protein product, partial [Prorocentrum cordatum]